MKATKRFLLVAVLCMAGGVIGCASVNHAPAGFVAYTEDAYVYEDEAVYAVYADQAGSYAISLLGDFGQECRPMIGVNGSSDYQSWNDDTNSVYLNKGINSIEVTNASVVEGISIPALPEKTEAGAQVTYTTYEAEEGKTNAAVRGDDRTYRTFSSEASQRSYVELTKTGDDISITLVKPANTLVIRYCIPDSADGKGIHTEAGVYIGEDYLKLELTSEYSWVYGAYPWNNDPSTISAGGGHRFFDDVRVKLDQVYPEGTVVTIRKEDFTNVDYLLVDVIEAEEIDSPLPQPVNSLNVLDYGAIPDDGEDDADAIMECVKAALEQEKEVYIPEGQFEIGSPFYVYGLTLKKDHVTIRGAGMWHTVLHGDAAGFSIRAGHILLSDFSLIGEVTSRRNSIDPCALDLTIPLPTLKDIRFQNLWIEHYKVGLWADVTNGISMMGCRIRNTFADGVNLCGGTSNSIITQNDIRNTGDDGIAMFSRGVLDNNIQITYNTVALPWLANNIALYGGKDIEVSHNLLSDTVTNGGGINISTNFTPQVFEGTILVEDNVLLRTGSAEGSLHYGGIWMNTVRGYDNPGKCIIRNNTILDSTYHGLSFHNSGVIEGMTIENNTIANCPQSGIYISGEARGQITVGDNKYENVGMSELENQSGQMSVCDLKDK